MIVTDWDPDKRHMWHFKRVLQSELPDTVTIHHVGYGFVPENESWITYADVTIRGLKGGHRRIIARDLPTMVARDIIRNKVLLLA